MGLLRESVGQAALDLPGFGHSPPELDGDYSLPALTEAARQVLAHEVDSAGGPVHLVGNSLGGAIAVRLAATSPDLVRTLVLTSPALPDLVPRRHTMGVPLVALPGVGEHVWRRMAKVPAERQVNAMVAMNYGNPSAVSKTRRMEAIADFQRRYGLDHAGHALSGSARGLLRSFLDSGPDNLWRQAAEISSPTLVMYGGRDRLVRPTKARKAAHIMPAARVVVLPNVGHVAQLEAPRLVGALVADFWNEQGQA
jgi:pimeloyl-ACP methyl ester carboxylesterase